MLKALNDYVGALLLTATVGLFTFSIVAYGKLATLDIRVTSLEKVTEQQIAINNSVNKLSETVAVLADRGERK